MKNNYGTVVSSFSWEDFKKPLLSFIKGDKRSDEFVYFKKDEAVSYFGIMYDRKEKSEQSAMLFFAFIYGSIPAELNRLMVKNIIEQMEQLDLDEIFLVADDPRLIETARLWQAEQLGKFNKYELDMDKAKRDIINTWLERIPLSNPQLRIEYYKEVPEEYTPQMAELLNKVLRDMPQEKEGGEKYHVTPARLKSEAEWRRKNEVINFHFLMFNEKDKLIGLTVARINLKKPDNVFQFMTGIAREYRGNELSKWLKAAMFFKIEEECPNTRLITTQMRAVNVAIQKINAEMGFELKNHGYEFKLTKDIFEDFLKS